MMTGGFIKPRSQAYQKGKAEKKQKTLKSCSKSVDNIGRGWYYIQVAEIQRQRRTLKTEQ